MRSLVCAALGNRRENFEADRFSHTGSRMRRTICSRSRQCRSVLRRVGMTVFARMDGQGSRALRSLFRPQTVNFDGHDGLYRQVTQSRAVLTYIAIKPLGSTVF